MAFGIIVVLFWRICYFSIGSENFSFVIFFWSMTREIVSYCIFLYLLDVLKILCISNILVFKFYFFGFIYSLLLGLSTICRFNFGCRFRIGVCVYNRENID